MPPQWWRDRLTELAWFIAHLADVRSDFSVYHRVDDLEAMPAHRFVGFLPRIPVYGGAVAFAIRTDTDSTPEGTTVTAQAPQTPMVDIRTAMLTDPLFMGLGTAVDIAAE